MTRVVMELLSLLLHQANFALIPLIFLFYSIFVISQQKASALLPLVDYALL